MARIPAGGSRMMRKVFMLFLSLTVLLPVQGCGHIVSKSVRQEVEPSLTFPEVLKNPTAFKGRTVIWGGEIVDTVLQKEGGTLVVVLQRPLDRSGRPRTQAGSEGRFLIHSPNYLDPYVYRRGQPVTVAGEVTGEMARPVGDMEYRYPVLSAKEVHLTEAGRQAGFPVHFGIGVGIGRGF